jgi:PilZ domain
MYDDSKKGYHHQHHAKTTGTGEADRRTNDRHSFTASAEVVELSSGAKFATRTTDLGPGGCFVDTLIPFPVGANVKVSVNKGRTHFQTGGVVVYSQAGLGMGIAFDDMEPEHRDALDNWLTELTGNRQTQSHEATAPSKTVDKRRAERAALVRLLRLLVGKGIITESESSSVLIDPLL